MKLLEKRPGELFFLFFILVGVVLTITVSLVEPNSGVAGRSFDDGLVGRFAPGPGASWAAENH